MTNLEIYKGAMALIGDCGEAGTSDYEERAAEIITMIKQALYSIDAVLKRRRGATPIAREVGRVVMSDDCGLEEELYNCACHYLASKLTAFEDSELSARLLSEADRERLEVWGKIPYEVERGNYWG